MYSVIFRSLVIPCNFCTNKTLHLNTNRSKHKNHFNTEIHLPHLNWFDHPVGLICRSEITGHRSQVAGHISQVTVTAHSSQVTGHRSNFCRFWSFFQCLEKFTPLEKPYKQTSLLCCSRKYPYPSHRRFFGIEPPTPPEIPFLCHTFIQKIWAFENPLPPGISINFPWGEHEYFLELQIIRANYTCKHHKSKIEFDKVTLLTGLVCFTSPYLVSLINCIRKISFQGNFPYITIIDTQ